MWGEYLAVIFFVFSKTKLVNLKEQNWRIAFLKWRCPHFLKHKFMALGIVKILIFLTVF